MPKTVYYASIGPELGLFDIDVEHATLTKRASLGLPANIQYVSPAPSRRFLYAASSNGGPGIAGDRHFANALSVDPGSGAVRLHGGRVLLPSRPIHLSVDRSGSYLLTAYNNPSHVTVHAINADGTVGPPIPQPDHLDTGIYAHQVLAAPSNRTVILVTRGNDATKDKPEDPGAIKTFAFSNGVLSNLASIAPGNGLGFGPRHLDFHPDKPWAFVSVERQNKLYVYKLDDGTGIAREPMFIRDTLLDPHTTVHQGAGPIHVHPNGRFVYQTNRSAALADFQGKRIFAGGENGVVVFAIDPQTGEPQRIQNIDGHGIHLRTFAIDPSGHMLVTASIMPLPVRSDAGITTLTAGITIFRIGPDGRLEFARKYDVDTGAFQQFWSGMVTLP